MAACPQAGERQGGAGPAGSWQLSRGTLKRPGRCHSNGGSFKRGVTVTSCQPLRGAAPVPARPGPARCTVGFPEAEESRGGEGLTENRQLLRETLTGAGRWQSNGDHCHA